MKHTMRLHSHPFELILQGNKTIETRLNDEKRRSISVGDIIEFVSREDASQSIEVRVTERLEYDTFEKLFDSHSAEDFGACNKEELHGIYQYYTKEQEKKWGVLGIVFEKD